MFNEGFRKATIQGTVNAMTGSAQERAKWKATVQDTLSKFKSRMSQDEADYLEALLIVLSDANRLEEADQLVPAAFAEDWKTILQVADHKLTSNAAGQSVSLEARAQIMNNTVAVMTHSVEHKGAWLQALHGLRQQAANEYKMPDLEKYLSLVI